MKNQPAHPREINVFWGSLVSSGISTISYSLIVSPLSNSALLISARFIVDWFESIFIYDRVYVRFNL